MKSYSFNLMGSILKLFEKRPHAFLKGNIEITGRSGIEPVTRRQLLIFFKVYNILTYKCKKFEWSMYNIKRATIFQILKIFHLLASNPWPVAAKLYHFSVVIYNSNSCMKFHCSISMGSIFKNYLKIDPMHPYGGKSIFGAS